jgi:Protein of unknown function (DUF1488)
MMAQWDVVENAVWFEITLSQNKVTCRIDGETLWKHFDADSPAETAAMRTFLLEQLAIEAFAAAKFLRGEYTTHATRRGPVVWPKPHDVILDE